MDPYTKRDFRFIDFEYCQLCGALRVGRALGDLAGGAPAPAAAELLGRRQRPKGEVYLKGGGWYEKIYMAPTSGIFTQTASK